MAEKFDIKSSGANQDDIPDSYYDMLYAQMQDGFIYKQDCIDHELERMGAWG